LFKIKDVFKTKI